MSQSPGSRLAWWSIDIASRLLDSDEREAVCGDLVESGARGSQALADLLGLVARRQAALWLHWAPWLALAGIAVPLGAIFSFVSRYSADLSAIDAFMYLNAWAWSLVRENPGFRDALIATAARDAVNAATLIGWSWTSGFALGMLSRRTLWITATAFVLVVVTATLGTTTVARESPYNAEVFAVPLYGAIFPPLLRLLLVLLPAWLGLRRSRRQPALSWVATIVVAVAIAGLTVWSGYTLGLAVTSTRDLMSLRRYPIYLGVLRLLPLLALWPATYMTVTAGRARYRVRTQS
jgi:hypothetical protein